MVLTRVTTLTRGADQIPSWHLIRTALTHHDIHRKGYPSVAKPGPTAPRPYPTNNPPGQLAAALIDMKEHWERVYSTKATTEVSWFQAHAALSLKLIQDATTDRSASIIDVGGGASTLVDDLLANGYQHLTVLDLSGAALTAAKARLGSGSQRVHWIESNVLEADLAAHGYDVWHDRAVFHFLTAEEERQAYVGKVLQAVRPGGLVIVATFSEDGPERCSGLPVKRYSANALHAEFGDSFQLLGHEREAHYTPSGGAQGFVYCFCRIGDQRPA